MRNVIQRSRWTFLKSEEITIVNFGIFSVSLMNNCNTVLIFKYFFSAKTVANIFSRQMCLKSNVQWLINTLLMGVPQYS